MMNVYQNQALLENGKKINKLGWEEAMAQIPEVKAQQDCSFGAKGWQPEYFQYYKKVAKVAGEELEFAFKAMNIWEGYEKYIIMCAKAHSLSVGDIVELNDEYFMVDSFGFKKVEVA